jgi:hypothetical protein
MKNAWKAMILARIVILAATPPDGRSGPKRHVVKSAPSPLRNLCRGGEKER